AGMQSGETPNVHGILESGATNTAHVIQDMFGSGISTLFLVAVPLALIALLALVFLPNKPLGRKTTSQRLETGEDTEAGFGTPAVIASAPARERTAAHGSPTTGEPATTSGSAPDDGRAQSPV